MAAYRGIAFPFRVSKTGEFPAVAEDEELIAESIRQLVGTLRGERVMRKDIGLDAMKYVFENQSGALDDALRYSILNLLTKYERRIAVTALDVGREGSSVTVQVGYKVLATQIEADVAIKLV